MKYRLIVADPPWSFATYTKNNSGMLKSPDQHYNTMKTSDICNIDVSSIAEKDSALVMWVYTPMLTQSLDVIKAWGFEFKTILFNWTKTTKDGSKPHFGLGYYTRQNTEIAILATKGKGLKPISRSIRQEIRTPKEEHSKKPDIFRDNLEQLFGGVSTIELFARPNFNNKYNWTLLGNEIDGKDINDAINEVSKM